MTDTIYDGTGKTADPTIGKTLAGNYLILDVIAEGGMAIVYKAKQISTDRMVAIKTLKTRDPNLMLRFAREVHTHAKLRHENIIEAIECFETEDQRSFLVMEFLEGTVLLDMIRSHGKIESEEAIASILIQILDGLTHAHQKEVIHRDLKPANIFIIDSEGQLHAKLLDFGIVKIQDDMQKLTTDGQPLGSPLYMSPEQCMGEDIGPRSDIYTMGVVAYEMITGRLPYQYSRLVEITAAHCDENTKPQPLSEHRPELAGQALLNQMILRAMETNPDNRFQTAAEFKSAIEAWIDSVRAGARSASPHVKAIKQAEKPAKADTPRTRVRKSDQNSTVKKARPQPGLGSSVPDPASALRNFLIGLTVCCITIVTAVFSIVNFDMIKDVFTRVSRHLSSLVPQAPTATTTIPSIKKAEPTPSPNENSDSKYSENSDSEYSYDEYPPDGPQQPPAPTPPSNRKRIE